MTEQRTRPTRVVDDGTPDVPVVRAGTRTAHAQAAKVLTTGASVSMVFGIVAYMAHSTAVAEEAAQLQELQAQQAAQLAAQQGGVAPSTTLPGSMPMMVVLPDGSIVPASTLIPGAVPTSAVGGAGGASVTMPTGTGTVAGGGTATTQPATTTPSGGGVVVTTVPATNPPVTLAPTTTVVVTVAPTTTVSGGSGTSN
ncbi:MAG: hypothetical protein RJB61_1262 [Actinomycetota bacterium]|jgi:D-serine deaminase-like pyridoxal phosphate-dependent protein